MKKILLSVLLLAGCMKIQSKDKAANKEQVVEQELSVKSITGGPEYKIHFREPIPDSYVVELIFPDSWPRQIFIVEKSLDKQNMEQVEINQEHKVFWPLKYPDQEVILEFFTIDKENSVKIGEVGFKSPSDYIFSGPKQLEDYKKFYNPQSSRYEFKDKRRIFFRDDLNLLTNGKKVFFSAEEIYFDGGLIRVFNENQKATFGQHGRDGGEIHFKADRLTGEGRFNLNAEMGGDGHKGAAPTYEMRGRNGERGTHAKVAKNMQAKCGLFGTCEEYNMLLPPTKGTNGQDGKKGFTGQKGSTGGDSANLKLEVKEIKDFLPRIEVRKARGGNGGEGGVGGEGGDPGVNGRCLNDELQNKLYEANKNLPPYAINRMVINVKGCEDFIDTYTPGQRGPQGDWGPEGEQGRINPVCYYVNNVSRCENY